MPQEPTEQESLSVPTSKTKSEIIFANYEEIALGEYMPSCTLSSFIEDTKCDKETPTHHTGFNHVENNSSWPLMQGLRNVQKIRFCNGKSGSLLRDKSCKHSWLLRL